MAHDTNKCYGCAHYDPYKFYCFKYLRPYEVAVYRCREYSDDEKEMREVCEKEMAYAEAQND